MTSLDQGTADTRDYVITVWMSEGLVWVALSETSFGIIIFHVPHSLCASAQMHAI